MGFPGYQCHVQASTSGAELLATNHAVSVPPNRLSSVLRLPLI
jgi:hypothetical protein